MLSIFRQRLEKLYGRVERTLDKAEEANELGVVAPLLNQAHKNVELLGKATGELADATAPQVSIQVICPSAPSPELTPRITYASVDAIEGTVDSEEEIGLLQKPT